MVSVKTFQIAKKFDRNGSNFPKAINLISIITSHEEIKHEFFSLVTWVSLRFNECLHKYYFFRNILHNLNSTAFVENRSMFLFYFELCSMNVYVQIDMINQNEIPMRANGNFSI